MEFQAKFCTSEKFESTPFYGGFAHHEELAAQHINIFSFITSCDISLRDLQQGPEFLQWGDRGS